MLLLTNSLDKEPGVCDSLVYIGEDSVVVVVDVVLRFLVINPLLAAPILIPLPPLIFVPIPETCLFLVPIRTPDWFLGCPQVSNTLTGDPASTISIQIHFIFYSILKHWTLVTDYVISETRRNGSYTSVRALHIFLTTCYIEWKLDCYEQIMNTNTCILFNWSYWWILARDGLSVLNTCISQR